MTIHTLYRVQCQPCERYLAEGWQPATASSSDSPLFLTLSSAYDEAVRRGWSAYPLICPDCARDLVAKKVRDGEARPDGDPPQDGRGLPESGQGPQ